MLRTDVVGSLFPFRQGLIPLPPLSGVISTLSVLSGMLMPLPPPWRGANLTFCFSARVRMGLITLSRWTATREGGLLLGFHLGYLSLIRGAIGMVKRLFRSERMGEEYGVWCSVWNNCLLMNFGMLPGSS